MKYDKDLATNLLCSKQEYIEEYIEGTETPSTQTWYSKTPPQP